MHREVVMRSINLPLQVDTSLVDEKGQKVVVQVDTALKRAVYADQDLSRGLENLRRGNRLLDAIDKFKDSCLLVLEEEDYRLMNKATESMVWGPIGYFLLPVLEKIKAAPEEEPKVKGGSKK
jgi:hypothetical protein